jgi:hypothetical protein
MREHLEGVRKFALEPVGGRKRKWNGGGKISLKFHENVEA